MTRDMTKAQFMAALARNGFKKPVLCWASREALPNLIGVLRLVKAERKLSEASDKIRKADQ